MRVVVPYDHGTFSSASHVSASGRTISFPAAGGLAILVARMAQLQPDKLHFDLQEMWLLVPFTALFPNLLGYQSGGLRTSVGDHFMPMQRPRKKQQGVPVQPYSGFRVS